DGEPCARWPPSPANTGMICQGEKGRINRKEHKETQRGEQRNRAQRPSDPEKERGARHRPAVFRRRCFLAGLALASGGLGRGKQKVSKAGCTPLGNVI